ncbi:MAG: 16S rRNA (cytosine(967)-C(5))-methyltransferase RsmB [Defluviitaleaceae bacterium]|nr:16S rRNA (cytosine(967)-C(5))-methyltransferase RsmB [Defluviitaleaceae bacterium]
MYINQREVAVAALTDIMDGGAYNNVTLRKALARNNALSRQDKAFVTEIVNGVLRNLLYLDSVLNSFSTTTTAKMKPLVLNILRTAVYQMLFMDKTPDFAACDESVKLVKKRGLAGLAPFVNGVLRNVARNKGGVSPNETTPSGICAKYSYPRWLFDYWRKHYGFETAAKICRGLHRPPAVTIAVNTLRTNKADLARELREEGVNVRDGFYLENSLMLSGTSDMSGLTAFREGRFFVMDEASMLAALAVSPDEGQIVLDVCCAPGGKACYMACLGADKARIQAFDIHEHKIWQTQDTLERLGLTSVTVSVADATVFDPALEACADRVLLDAPCSGLGLIRKKPEIKYRRTMKDVNELADLQRRMLANVSRYVAPGGVLVYSVCTVSPKECEGMADWFAANFPFDAVPVGAGAAGKPGIATTPQGHMHIFPTAEEASADGFFVAKFRRRGAQ